MEEDILKTSNIVGEERELCKIVGTDEFEFSLIQRIDSIDDKLEFVKSFSGSAGTNFSKKLIRQKDLILSILEDYNTYKYCSTYKKNK